MQELVEMSTSGGGLGSGFVHATMVEDGGIGGDEIAAEVLEVGGGQKD